MSDSDVCNLVAERVALGEPVGEADHVASCARCQRTIALPAQLAHARAAIDPGPGFSARVTAGAQTRLGVRRRRRVARGIAATALASALGLVIVVRPSGDPIRFNPQIQAPHHADPDPWGDNSDVEALVRFADVDHASHLGASWGRIEKPLAPYRALIKGMKP